MTKTDNIIINVAEFVDGKMRDELLTLTDIRNKILDECYSINGYSDLTLDEKNKIYNAIREKFIDENGNIIKEV